jgi:hypothetical protein
MRSYCSCQVDFYHQAGRCTFDSRTAVFVISYVQCPEKRNLQPACSSSLVLQYHRRVWRTIRHTEERLTPPWRREGDFVGNLTLCINIFSL